MDTYDAGTNKIERAPLRVFQKLEMWQFWQYFGQQPYHTNPCTARKLSECKYFIVFNSLIEMIGLALLGSYTHKSY